jgi:hypothetical protein
MQRPRKRCAAAENTPAASAAGADTTRGSCRVAREAAEPQSAKAARGATVTSARRASRPAGARLFAQALDKHFGVTQHAPEPAAHAPGLPRGGARDLLKLSAFLVKDLRHRGHHLLGVLAVRLQLALEAGNLKAGIIALVRDLMAIFGGGQELSVLIIQRLRETLDRRQNGRQVRRRRRRLAWLTCCVGLAPGLKNLHQTAFGDRCDGRVVAEVALQLAALHHPLDGSPAHSQRLRGLIEVNEIVFGCSRQQYAPPSSKSVAICGEIYPLSRRAAVLVRQPTLSCRKR